MGTPALAEPRSRLPVALLVTCALIVNLTSIGRPALWRDEVATIVVARQSPSAIVHLLRHDDAPFGTYYLLMHFWLKVSADASWVRLPSAIGAAVSVGFLYLLGKRLAGTVTATVSSLVLVALPFSTRFAQEARPYALVMCGATASTWLLVRALGSSERSWWAWYSFALAATVALHVLAVTLVVAQLATCVAVYGRRLHRYRRWIAAVLPALFVGGVIALVTAGNSTSHAWIPATQLRTPYYALLDFTGSRTAAFLLLGLLVMGSLLIVGRRNRRAPVLGVGSVAIPWLVLPTACLLAGSLYHPIFVSRYVLFSLPALALLAGAAVVDVGRAVGLSRSTPALRTSVAAVCIGVLALVVAKPQAELRRLDAHGDDPAAEAAYLISVTKPGDGIVYAPRDLVHSLVPYATQGQLPADALLARSATASSTLNGVQVGAAQVPAALLRYDRLWVLDIPGLEDDDPLAITTGAILATHFHEVSVTAEHGVQIVLYLRIGS